MPIRHQLRKVQITGYSRFFTIMHGEANPTEVCVRQIDRQQKIGGLTSQNE
jgi:hypothetical protein